MCAHAKARNTGFRHGSPGPRAGAVRHIPPTNARPPPLALSLCLNAPPQAQNVRPHVRHQAARAARGRGRGREGQGRAGGGRPARRRVGPAAEKHGGARTGGGARASECRLFFFFSLECLEGRGRSRPLSLLSSRAHSSHPHPPHRPTAHQERVLCVEKNQSVFLLPPPLPKAPAQTPPLTHAHTQTHARPPLSLSLSPATHSHLNTGPHRARACGTSFSGAWGGCVVGRVGGGGRKGGGDARGGGGGARKGEKKGPENKGRVGGGNGSLSLLPSPSPAEKNHRRTTARTHTPATNQIITPRTHTHTHNSRQRTHTNSARGRTPAVRV